MGRPMVPAALHAARGEPGKRRHGETFSPSILSEVPDPPEAVRVMAHGQEAWKMVVPPLVDCGVLSVVDLPALVMVVSSLAEYLEAGAHMQDEGLIIDTEHGPRRNPWWSVRKDSLDAFVRLGSKFGLNPSDRTRILGTSEGSKEDDPFQQFLDG